MKRRVSPRTLFISLSLLCLLAIWLSLALGPVSLPMFDTLRAGLRLLGLPVSEDGLQQAEMILGQIRLPRTLLGLAVGAVLALSGVAMQGLFRNPLADPGLVGRCLRRSGGSGCHCRRRLVWRHAGCFRALSAVVLRVCRRAWGNCAGLPPGAPRWPDQRRHDAIGWRGHDRAGGAAVGLFSYLADDATLRTLTFWNLGSLNGASYERLWPLLLVATGVAVWLPRRAKALNALLLGESEARHLGVDVERLKRELVFCTALGVGAAVAAAGLIGFIGLVVPHLVRLLAGPDHRVVLPASLLAGGVLMLFADLAARLLLAPAELPIGIVTAFIGAPFFLFLLMRGRG